MADADHGLITDAATESEDWGLVTEGVVTELDWGLLVEDGGEEPVLVLDITDAVVAALNGGTWSQSFTAVRVAVPGFTLPELAELKVAVASRSSEPKPLTRSSFVTVVDVEIAVLKKLDGIAASDIAPYVRLVDEIVRHFRGVRLAGYPNALPIVTRPDPLYDEAALETKRSFISVATIQFKVFG